VSHKFKKIETKVNKSPHSRHVDACLATHIGRHWMRVNRRMAIAFIAKAKLWILSRKVAKWITHRFSRVTNDYSFECLSWFSKNSWSEPLSWEDDYDKLMRDSFRLNVYVKTALKFLKAQIKPPHSKFDKGWCNSQTLPHYKENRFWRVSTAS